MSDTVEQLTGIIPVVAAGGVVMKFTEGVFGTPGKTRNKKRKAKRTRKYSSPLYKSINTPLFLIFYR